MRHLSTLPTLGLTLLATACLAGPSWCWDHGRTAAAS
jgi:hypothetical protein